ncbi:hypothetical protein LXL04_019756 [Taraxacum kok-saghyz]
MDNEIVGVCYEGYDIMGEGPLVGMYCRSAGQRRVGDGVLNDGESEMTSSLPVSDLATVAVVEDVEYQT